MPNRLGTRASEDMQLKYIAMAILHKQLKFVVIALFLHVAQIDRDYINHLVNKISASYSLVLYAVNTDRI